jgi:hypothetical protein
MHEAARRPTGAVIGEVQQVGRVVASTSKQHRVCGLWFVAQMDGAQGVYLEVEGGQGRLGKGEVRHRRGWSL